MRTIRHRSSLLATVPAVLVLASCGGGDAAEDSVMDDEPAAVPVPASTVADEISVTLQPTEGYEAEGVAMITREGEDYMVHVAVDSGLPQADYPAHIHEGTCAEGGSVAVPLVSIAGQEAGEGEQDTRVPASQLSATASYFVQVHAPNGAPIACADLPPINL